MLFRSHWPLTYHSYHQPLSLPLIYQHLQSITSLLFTLQQHHLLPMSIPITSPCPVHQGSLLKNLQMKSSSPTLCYPLSTSPLLSIGENSVDENMPEHVQISMSYEGYAMMINPLIYDPFLDWIVHFQRELPLPNLLQSHLRDYTFNALSQFFTFHLILSNHFRLRTVRRFSMRTHLSHALHHFTNTCSPHGKPYYIKLNFILDTAMRLHHAINLCYACPKQYR